MCKRIRVLKKFARQDPVTYTYTDFILRCKGENILNLNSKVHLQKNDIVLKHTRKLQIIVVAKTELVLLADASNTFN